MLISAPLTMPASPAMEPTDRSIPPLRITNVMPIARIALIATCLIRIVRLPVVRNSGVSTENTATSRTRAMTARRRRSHSIRDTRIDALLSAGLERAELSTAPIGTPLGRKRNSRCGRRERVLRRVLRVVLAGDPAAGHDDDSRRRGHHLVQLG